MKKLIQFLFACLAVVSAMAAEPAKPSVFQLRLVVEEQSDQSEAMTLPQTGDKTVKETFHVQKKVLLDQTALKNAFAGAFSDKQIDIRIEFTEAGGKQFAKVTRENSGKRLAIVIDGQLYSAPIVREEILTGVVSISGGFTEKEAKDLAAKIMAAVAK